MALLPKIAWRNIWRNRRRSLITAFAMGLGVSMCMASTALIDGMYLKMFSSMVEPELGHIQIHHPDFPRTRSLYDTLEEGEATLTTADATPGVIGAAPRVKGYALIAADEKAMGATLTGVDPTREAKVTIVHDKLTQGRYLSEDAAQEIILGSGLAKDLKAKIGAEIVAITQAADGSTGNELYTVVGIFETGLSALDRRGVFLHIEDLQSLLALGSGIHEVAIMTPSRETIPKVKAALDDALKGENLLIRTWGEVNPAAAQMIAMQDVSFGIFMVIIFGVAGLGILNTMLMSVFERTRELGVMNALGLTPRQVITLILWETLFLAGLALALGGAVGGGMQAYLIFHGWDLSAYMDGFDAFGVNIDPVLRGAFRADRIIDLGLSLFFISIVAAIWPAIRAARLEPVSAMREL